MVLTGLKRAIKSTLITSLMTGSAFLLPVESAFAVTNLSFSTSFQPVDGTARNYQDTAGTWDAVNNLDVTDTTGDTFSLVIQNTAGAGVTDAFDLEISVVLPTGFRLPQTTNFNVPVTITGSGCSNVTSVDADQSGNTVTFDFNSGDELSAGCRYQFDLGLTTNNSISSFPFAFATACIPGDAQCDIRFDITHNETNNTPATQQNNAITHQTRVNAGLLSLSKTATTTNAVDGTAVSYDVTITNTGTGGLFSVDLTDSPSSNFSFDQMTIASPFVPPDPQPGIGVTSYTFNHLTPGQSTTVTVNGDANIAPNDTTCDIRNAADVVDRTGLVTASDFDSVPYNINNHLTISHDLTSSFCLLCGQGEVIINVANTGGITLTNVTVTENLSAGLILPSGLRHVSGSTLFNGIAAPNPTPGAGGTLIWNIGDLDSPSDLSPSNPVTMEIRFSVERDFPTFSQEGLANPAVTDRSIEATADFTSVCGPNPATITTGVGILPLRQPEPVVAKTGWNTDSGQTEATATEFVYGHEDDDVIWRVEVTNNGLADLEDLVVMDQISSGSNFDFFAVCDNEPNATATADTQTLQGTCVSRSGLTASPFPPTSDPDAVTPNGTNVVYYVGRVLASCSNATNTSDIEWGCEADGTQGGINAGNSTIPAADIIDTADLNTDVSGPDQDTNVTNLLDVDVEITGTNTAQPAGSRGRVTITLTNDTGGTIRNITMQDILPMNGGNPVYVVDPSIPNVVDTTTNNPAFDIQMIPANGAASYDGMIDRVTWTNPVSIVDATLDPLGNTSPAFTLDSTTVNPDTGAAFRDNLMRHGDQLIVSFDIVLVESSRYDLIADLDVREEVATSTDPDNTFNISNQLTVNYTEACAVADSPVLVINDNFTANPEDLDVDIVDPNINFILNIDPNITLPLTVRVNNNGGHDADNYFLVVTFGAAMEVDSSPVGCSDISTPPVSLPRPYWDLPVPIPVSDSPTIFECNSGVIGAGAQVDFDFVVSRPDPVPAIDDLTFRADIVGEIQLSDGTPLVFPAVTTTPTAQIDNVANNYTLDGVRARVIGFGLTKALEGDCTEQLTAPGTNDQVLIGEDCRFKIVSGGWFGFDTPGFGIIAVHNITVFDQLPDGQGFISQTDGGATTIGGGSDPEITNITFLAGVNPLDEGTVNWNFNPVTSKLTDRDKFFRTDITSRILNDPIDTSATLPNRHDEASLNILNTTFDADFEDSAGNPGVFSFGPTTTGYPTQDLRSFSLTVTQPNLIVEKTVCNETLAGGPGSCVDGDFQDLVNTGDTQDAYVYRIRITNDDPAGSPTGVARAPAYNVVVRDVLDSSDLMQVTPIETPVLADPLTYPFLNDGLDNDDDGFIDSPAAGGNDPDGEGLILTDNNVNIPANINPAEIEFSYLTTDALLQIDDGETVDLFYRVDPDDSIAPLQLMTNTVSTAYDTLLGDFSNQNTPQIAAGATDGTNANIIAGVNGSARVLTTAGETARVQILPLAVEPKLVVQTATQPGAGPLSEPINVVPGEEVQYRLRTQIPVANLREFQIVDELPPGMRCVDAPTVNLDVAPFDVAGFVPGGSFTPSCDPTGASNIVLWNFGDQELTAAQNNTRFEFVVEFIARVENTALTDSGCIIRNGGSNTPQASTPPTQVCNVDTFVRTSYRNDPSQGSVLIEHFFDPVQVVVTEPELRITKTFVEVGSGIPGTDETSGDAQDIFEVRIDIENIGNAPAHNPQVLDNLNNTKYTYLGNVGGNDPPLTDSVSFPLPLTSAGLPPAGLPGSNQPIFSWTPGTTIPPGPANAISFTYRVQSNGNVEPLENLPNTAEVKWTSLENVNVALNSGGSIGVDGDELGMRIGHFDSIETAPANTANDYRDENVDIITVPPLQFSKTDLDLAADNTDTSRTIGEHRRYQLEIVLPEGTTTDINITDNIAFGDEPYVLENAAPFEVSYQFIDIQTVNGVAPVDGTTSSGSNAETIFTAVPADEASPSAVWNIGTVVTATEDDKVLNPTPTVNPRILITYYARVDNVDAIRDGDNLRNEATLQYTSGLVPATLETITVNTANVGVVEPDLTVTKTVTNITVAGDPDAGDVLEYVITVVNNGNSTAFDTNIIDIIDPNVTLDTVGFTPTATITDGGTPQAVAGFITTPALGSATTPTTDPDAAIVWGRDNGDNSLAIPSGEQLVLTFRVTVNNSVQPLQLISNNVVVDWTSLDGVNALERFGIGGADCSASVAPNDYCATLVAPTTITTQDTNTIVKSINTDTSLVPGDSDVRIGDIITYQLTLTMQEGTTRNLTLVDTLPNGLEVIDIVSVNGDTDADTDNDYDAIPANGFVYNSGPIVAPILPAGAGNNVLSFNLGEIENTAGVGSNDFIILYRAVVTEAEFVLPQVATTAIDNTVVLDYIVFDGTAPAGAPLSRLSSVLNLDTQEPVIFTANVVKDRFPSGTLSGTGVSPSDLMDFRLLACNVGGGPAYDLILTDDLPVELNHTSIVHPVTPPGTPDVDFTDPTGVTQLTQLTNTLEYTYTPPAVDGGNMVFTFNNQNAPLLPNQCIRIMFNINVDAGVGTNISWENEFRVDEYHSLDANEVNADVSERQDYALAGPVFFSMNTVTPNNPPDKILDSPRNATAPLHDEATIGEVVTYQITVPDDDDGMGNGPMVVNLFDVRIEDQLSTHVTFVDAVLDGSSPYTQVGPLQTSVNGSNLLNITLDDRLSTSGGITQPAIINVTARVSNVPATNSGVAAFNNTARYFYRGTAGAPGEQSGGSDTTIADDNIFVVEPQVNLIAKTVANQTQANADTDAGDILLYTLTFSTSGGAANDAFSDAQDISIVSTLTPGLDFCSVTEDANCINPTSTVGTLESDRSVIRSGAGTTVDPYIITWNSVNGTNTDIDVSEGTALVTITYTVKVTDTVLANQALNSATSLSWTSLDGAFGTDERTYTANFTSPADLTVPDTNNLIKAFESSTSTLGGNNVRIGDTVDYQITIQAQESSHQNLVLTDTLPQGLQFEGIVSMAVTGQPLDNDGSFEATGPFSFTTFNQDSVSETGDATAAGGSTIELTLQNFINTGNNNAADDDLVIIYRVRVLDQVLNPTVSNFDLANNLQMQYGINGGTQTDTALPITVNVDHPSLAITKSSLNSANINAGDIVSFTIQITNSGASDAYDLVLEDILPPGLRNGATPVTITSVEMPVGTGLGISPVQDLSNVATTGQILWDFDVPGNANALTIPAGETLELNYDVQADANIAAGLDVDNQATVTVYYSFDDEQIPLSGNAVTGATPQTIIAPPVLDDREEYAPSNTGAQNITTVSPGTLTKTIPSAITEVSIGQPFTYRIQVPSVDVDAVLHDVRITDNLSTIPNTDLIFLSVVAVNDDAPDGNDPDEDDAYSPVNSGSPNNLVIEDLLNGIEIPNNESISVDITVQLRNTPGINVDGRVFANTANYTFNSVDGDNASQGNGTAGSSPNLTIVEPVLVINKTGPAGVVTFNNPIPYTIEIENTGTGPAFDTTVIDVLPNVTDNPPLTGGTCDTAPANISAQIIRDDNVVIHNLVLGTDYNLTHTPATCEVVITTLTTLAAIENDERLVLNYETRLDVDSMNGALLTNNISVTEYFSQDTPAGVQVGEIRRYENNPSSTLDEDSFQVTVEAPELSITKIPSNITSGGSGAFADPGDELSYAINIVNTGPIATGTFSFTDELDRLNPAPGYFDFSSISDVAVDGVPVTFTATGGILTVPNLSLDQTGGTNDSLVISFNINLISVITAGTIVQNQGEVNLTGFNPLLTDDPSIAGATNPTETLIDAAPAFSVKKRSADITGDPDILRQGDTLRYTIEVKNIGLENVNNAFIRDLVPANTTYVAGSTRLNGLVVADLTNGASPLENEILINAPENTTPGVMLADANLDNTNNVASIIFDVVVDEDVVDGTVISNQAFVGGLGAGSGPFAEQASDNPDTTSLANDPTINVVGNLPTIDAQKTVSLVNDIAANDVIDTGDTLEYEIVVTNAGAIAATQVTLIDAIPANSAYVANSVTLNGTLITDANLVSLAPLTVRLNSSDLGLPDQSANDGQITTGNEAIVRFRVNVTGIANSVISNQGAVTSNELPEQLTDSDGNSTNGFQPTVVTVGAGSELQLTKEVFVVSGGVAQAGGELEYVLQVTNTGLSDATNIVLTDIIPTNVTYTLGSTKLDSSTAFIGSGVAEPGANLTVNYQLAKGVLEAGEKFTVSYRVTSDSSLVPGTAITNTVSVDWTENPSASPISDNASIEIGGAPGVGVIGGHVWHDVTRTPVDTFTPETDLNLQDWVVQVYLNNPSRNLFAATLTDENGRYQFKGLPAGSAAGGDYELRFLLPGGSDTSASMGVTVADVIHGAGSGTIGQMSITGITVGAGANIAQQSLPAIPQGIVYDSVLRTPVGGAELQLLQANGTPVPSNCLPANSNQATQTVLNNGFYRFDIQAASCGINEFLIAINEIPGGYLTAPSQIIPPGKENSTRIDVPVCSDSDDDAIDGNDDCDIQFSVEPPGTNVPVRTEATKLSSGGSQGTTYYLEMRVNANGEIAFNNHIPLDPELDNAIAISKTSAMVNVTRSQLVPYTITLTNNLPAPLYDLNIVDLFPPGFKYVAGSGRIQFGNGAWVKTEPVASQGLDGIPESTLNDYLSEDVTDRVENIDGVESLEEFRDVARLLTWDNIGTIDANSTVALKLLLVVGSGVGEGEYVNRAVATNRRTSGAASLVANATVRVVPDPTFDCSDVIGKVFDDKNLNAYQDEGEEGLSAVRVLTARGLEITTDANGRFHLTCAVVPNPDRGSNFIIKLDERSLPTGYRLTTENPRVVRATRGKMVKFNFGAAIHRVVRLDMADAVFESDVTDMRPQWLPRLDLLITELAKDPSLLRLSYLAENESESLVNKRLDSVKTDIQKRWNELNCCYQLTIETEVFWRKGGPPNREEFNE